MTWVRIPALAKTVVSFFVFLHDEVLLHVCLLLMELLAAEYHSCDFDFNEHKVEMIAVPLPNICEEYQFIIKPQVDQWNSFFKEHKAGKHYYISY